MADPNYVTLGLTAGVSLLGGGLAGAVLNHFLHFYRRPRLHLIFDPNEPGCEVDTNTIGSTEITQRYLRIKILNTGRLHAKNVSVCATRIAFKTANFREEVLDLPVGRTGETVFSIAPGGHRFLDLCFIKKVPQGLEYGLSVKAGPVRVSTFGWGVGPYRAEIFASADDAKPRRAEVKWSWDGTLKGLHAISLGYMF